MQHPLEDAAPLKSWSGYLQGVYAGIYPIETKKYGV